MIEYANRPIDINVNGKKIVRVNDVRLASIAGDIRVVAVDPGFKGLARRYGFYKMLKVFYKFVKKVEGCHENFNRHH